MRITTLVFRLAATLLPALTLSTGLRAQQLDPSFHSPVLVAPTGAAFPFVSKVVRQADGRYLIAGSFESVDGHPTLGLARLLPDGHVDPSFTSSLSSGRLGYSVVLAVQPDGAVLLGQSDTTRQASLQRLLPTGQPDPSFTAALRPVRDGHRFDRLLVQPDGKLLLAGATTDSLGRSGLLRLLPSGRVDPGFTPPQLPGNSRVADVLLEPSGRMVFSSSDFSFNVRATLLRLLPSGQVDPSFAFTPSPAVHISRLALCPDGGYALGGFFSSRVVMRLLPSGAVDAGFGPAGNAIVLVVGFNIANNPTYAVAVQPDGRILAGGDFYDFNSSQRDYSLLQTLPQGGLDSGFDLNFIRAQVFDLLVEPSGKVMVAGTFNQAGGVSHYGLARLLAAAPLATSPGVPTGTLRAWPVPAHGQLSVQLPAGKAVRELTLLDATGRVALRVDSPAAGELRLPTAALPAGLYVLRVRYADGSSRGQRVALD